MTETAKLEALTFADQLHHAIDEYWRIAWREGAAGRVQDTAEGDAERVRSQIDGLISALSVSRPAVKGLVWDEPSGKGATPYYWAIGAKTQTKGYRIDWEGYGLGHTDHPGPYKLMDIGSFPTVEAAKAAAQSDFEQRILSSLSPPTGE